VSEHKYKVGDAVRLTSGGDRMTVESYGDSRVRPTVHCLWFDRQGQLQGLDFAEDALTGSPDPATKLIYARLVSETLRACAGNPQGLALVELPPNCSIDATTGEVQSLLKSVIGRLQAIEDCGGNTVVAEIRDLERVRTLIGIT
jgi:uncharacterized protein YodC (DUF2158 family)